MECVQSCDDCAMPGLRPVRRNQKQLKESDQKHAVIIRGPHARGSCHNSLQEPGSP